MRRRRGASTGRGPRRPSARSGTRSWLKKSTRRRATRRDDDERRDRGQFGAREGDVPTGSLATSAIAAPVTPTPNAARRCDAPDAKDESCRQRRWRCEKIDAPRADLPGCDLDSQNTTRESTPRHSRDELSLVAPRGDLISLRAPSPITSAPPAPSGRSWRRARRRPPRGRARGTPPR